MLVKNEFNVVMPFDTEENEFWYQVHSKIRILFSVKGQSFLELLVCS